MAENTEKRHFKGPRLHLMPPGGPPIDPGTTEGALHEAADGLLRRAMRHLDKLLGAVEGTLASGDCSPALARESAGVARALTGLAGELRQRERHIRDAVRAMPSDERDALILEYLRDLAPERRAAVVAFLDELGKDQLLG